MLGLLLFHLQAVKKGTVLVQATNRTQLPEWTTARRNPPRLHNGDDILAAMPPHSDPIAQDPRVYLAAERTLLAWIRTGLALMGFGFVVARFGLFLRELATAHGETGVSHTPGYSLWFGVALVCVGVLVNIFAAWDHRRIVRGLRAGDIEATKDSRMGVWLAVLLAVIGGAMTAYLVLVGR